MTEAKADEGGAVKQAVVDTAALQALIKSKTSLTLLDARTGKFDDGKRIPGAQSLAPDAEKEAIEKMLPAKDALIVTYCANLKCPASRKLAERLLSLGYENVVEYPQGIGGWIQAGNEVVTVQ